MARRWFDVDGVSAVADLTNSAVALAVQQLAKGQGKVTLSSGPATTRLTNEDCSPTGFHWAFDTYSQAVGTAKAVVATGGKSWFILAADYAFGHQMAADLDRVVKESGGTVLGSPRRRARWISSFLLQAQSSKAQIIGLANAGADTVNSIKQAGEFGIMSGGQKIAGLVVVISDIHALGLKTANGLLLTTAFYWDRDEASRKWSKRFFDRTGRMPGMVQASTYSSVLHYLKAMQAAGKTDGKAVADKMRERRWTTPSPRAGARRRAPAARHVPGRSQKAGRIQGPVGLLQDPAHHPGRGRRATAQPEQVLAGQAVILPCARALGARA